MSAAEKEHLLALKVMRLTKPMLTRANLVYIDGRDIEDDVDPFYKTNLDDININQHTPYESNSPVLVLPQAFGNIFLGETFSSYISIHNTSQSACRNVSMKIELQAGSNRLAITPTKTDGTVAEIPPGQSLDDIISHEVKEMGTHILVCTVTYATPTHSRMELKKFYKFQVLKPLELKTKFVDSESGDVYLEAQIQNITPGGVYLERVSMDPAQNFTCEDLSRRDSSDPFERYINSLDMYQFLFRISPSLELRESPKLLKSTTAMGRLDIVWRSSMGERGRLQTSPLQRLVPGSRDVKLVVKSMQSVVKLEQLIDIRFQLINASDRNQDLKIELINSAECGILWQGISARHVGLVKPNQSISLNHTFIPIKLGLQTVSGIRVFDMAQKRPYEFDSVAHLFVE